MSNGDYSEGTPLTSQPVEPHYPDRARSRYYCPGCGTVRRAVAAPSLRVDPHYRTDTSGPEADGRWTRCEGGPVTDKDRAP